MADDEKKSLKTVKDREFNQTFRHDPETGHLYCNQTLYPIYALDYHDLCSQSSWPKVTEHVFWGAIGAMSLTIGARLIKGLIDKGPLDFSMIASDIEAISVVVGLVFILILKYIQTKAKTPHDRIIERIGVHFHTYRNQ